MNDLISRQAAIDVCNKAIDLWQGQLGEGIVIAVRKKIEQLPSAQPEIIRCKDCKFNVSRNHKCLQPDSFFLVTEDDFYCGYAERRTDE